MSGLKILARRLSHWLLILIPGRIFLLSHHSVSVLASFLLSLDGGRTFSGPMFCFPFLV